MTLLTDLPTDILYNVFLYLDVGEFLSLTSSSKALFSYSQDPTFWRILTRRTFRIPPQPLLQADGARWQWLYKHLITQTRLFTWGNNDRGNLDQDVVVESAEGLGHRRITLRDWPGKVKIDEDIGIVADVQCGGWSTTLLNSTGGVYVLGIVNGLNQTFHSSYPSLLRRLEFPSSYTPTSQDHYEPSTAIQQLSVGRSHILGLADNGNIWTWIRTFPSFLVQSLNLDLHGRRVTRVVAGWDRSSIYANDVGIIYWAPNQNPSSEEHDSGSLLTQMAIIPSTGFRRARNERVSDSSSGSRIGTVTTHIVLEGYIVFTTDLHKVFSYPTTHPEPDLDQPEPVELTTFYPDPSSEFQIRDLQGSYRSFAVFTQSGSVLIASCSLLDGFHRDNTTKSSRLPEVIPALQNKSIISISFGDHHFHALHANGTLSSYGTEPRGCGALGLGGRSVAKLRGVSIAHHARNTTKVLEPVEPRTVWFEPMMKTWLEDMSRKAMEGEAQARGEMLQRNDYEARVAVGDYFERQGACWEDGLTAKGELGAYFVLKASAAGWHSAALVLVDEKKAEQARAKHILPPSSPSTPQPSGAPTEPSPSPNISWLYNLLISLARWFLGLTARDAAGRGAGTGAGGGGWGATSERNRERVAQSAESGPLRGQEKYTWTEQPFPRLRMRNREVMPGEIEVTELY